MNKGLQTRSRGFFKQKPILRLVVALVALFSLIHLFSRYPHATLLNNTPRATVGKVMMIYGNNSVYERAIETHKEHCNRLGYPLFILRREVLDGVWNKLAYLISLIVQELEKPEDERLEWLYWIDSDTILMNPNMRLETFLPPPHLTNVHIVLSRDWNGMNAGVFPIRVDPWSIKLLSAAISYPYTNPEETLTWAEQTAMVKLLAEHDYFAQSAVYVPLRWFNAYMRSPDGESLNTDSRADLQVHPGDLLVHFPGTPREDLNDTLSPYLAIAEQHRSEWELPLEKTGYAEETARFWKKYGIENGFELPDVRHVQEISNAGQV